MDNRDRDFGDDDDRIDLEDPLGIARTPVTRDDFIKGSDAESSRQRRRRWESEEERSNGLGDLDMDPSGATGIDMGYEGQGTNIKSSK